MTNRGSIEWLAFRAVLMDTWYTTKDLMLYIESLQKLYYCPVQANRQVDDSGSTWPYQRWTPSRGARRKPALANKSKLKAFRRTIT